MKKIVTLIVFTVVFYVGLNAQVIHEVDGIYYADDLPYTGTYKSYDDNFQLKMEMKLLEGKKEGITKLYFEDGSLQEIRSYKNNLMDGLWITYNEKGVKIAEANYVKGKKNGTWKVWDEQGILRVEMSYKHGAKFGTWTRWNQKGEILGEKVYN